MLADREDSSEQQVGNSQKLRCQDHEAVAACLLAELVANEVYY